MQTIPHDTAVSYNGHLTYIVHIYMHCVKGRLTEAQKFL